MPILVVNQNGSTRVGTLRGRVVMGRWASGQLTIDDPVVSRIHAWIGQEANGTYFLADAGSRSGTFLNGQRIETRKFLNPGDVIRVGKVEARLLADEDRPPDVEEIDLTPRPWDAPTPGAGIMTDCVCGAPIWAPWDFAGRSGLCRTCGELVTIPAVNGAPAAGPQVDEAEPAPICGVCHAAVHAYEESARCPECHTSFHIECWTENQGCSTYGCGQVSALASNDMQTTAQSEAPRAPAGAETIAPPSPPWDYLLLGASVVGLLASALSFGLPSLAVLIVVGVRLGRGQARQRGVVMTALLFAILGAIAGAGVSYLWWMGNRSWPARR